MRAVLQRVVSARVEVEGESVGEIGAGLLILLGVHQADTTEEVDWLVQKISQLRIFEDESGKMNRSLLEEGGEALVVSQFTLHADCRKGRRPSFVEAARPETAIPLYADFCKRLELEGVRVATGTFGAKMAVSLTNDGPVTLVVDTPPPKN